MQKVSRSLILLTFCLIYFFNISEIIHLNQIIYSERYGLSDVFGTLKSIQNYIEYLNDNEKKITLFYYSDHGNLELINPIVALTNFLISGNYIRVYQFSFLNINLINFVSLYILFNYFICNKYISIIITLIFTFNPEFDLRLYKGHLNLYMYFSPVLTILFFEKIIEKQKNLDFILLIFTLIFSMIYSQYYFYFSLVYIFIRTLVYIKFNYNNIRIKDTYRYFIYFVFFVLLFFIVYQYLLIPTNIFEQIKYDQNRLSIFSLLKYSVKNPIEYFFPISNIFEYNFYQLLFGEINEINKILIEYKDRILKNGLNTGEFRHFIGLVIPTIIYIYFKLNREEISQNKEILITSILLFVLTIIPFSLILFIVPYFRVVSRLLIFTDILVFILLGKSILFFLNFYKNKILIYLLIIIIPFSFNSRFYKEKNKTLMYNEDLNLNE